MVYEILLIFAVGLIPGYLLASLDRRLDDLEKLALSFGLSFLVFGGVSLLLHMTGVPIIYSLLAAVPMCGIAIFRKIKLSLKVGKFLLAILVVAFVIRFVLQFFFQSPLIGDSYFHMDLGRTFTTDDWFEVNAVDSLWTFTGFPFPEDFRPPFWNFVLGFFYNIFGTSFYISKLVSVLVGVIAIVPTYLIARKVGGERAAILASAVVAFSPVLIGHAFEAEVKMITVYLTLVSIYFFMKGRQFWGYAGIMAGLLYITAYSSGTALVLSYLAYLVFMNRKELLTKQTLALAVIFFVIISPWLARNYLIFGDPLYSSSKYVTYIGSFDELYYFERPTFDGFINYVTGNPGGYLFDKITNLYRTLFPLPVKSVQGQLYPDFNPVTNLNLILRPISMIITIPILMLAVYYILKSMPKMLKEKNLLVAYSIISVVLALVLWTPKANLFFLMFPQIFVFAILGSAVFEGLKMRPNMRKLVYVVIAILLIVPTTTYLTRQNATPDIGQSWVLENTSIDDIIMVRWTDVHIFNLHTDRKILPIPYEDAETVVKFARENKVSYMIVDQLDFDVGKFALRDVQERLSMVDVYEVKDVTGSGRVNKRYIFEVGSSP